ncbi:MAG: glycosyltransferase family 4 protein [Gaiellaceae bacterium]|jgi:glycosyltransferase involved in cell wall biosynthesis
MKVVLALLQPPFLEGGAPGKCAVALLRGLRTHGVDVSAVAARQCFAIPGEVPADLPVELVQVAPEAAGWRTRLNRVRRPRGGLGRGDFAARFRELATDADLLHLEETETAWADEGLALPSLVHIHYLVRRDRDFPWPQTRMGRDTIELELAERAAIRRHRYLVASSPLIADELRRRAPKADVVLAPLSLDPGDYRPASLDGPPVAGIIGTATWPPTANAMRRLVTRVWPRVRAQLPEARLLIAGRHSLELGLPEGEGVEVMGEVASAREFLQDLSVLLYPLEHGSGVKVKTLEAIASGVPVVTTPAGAEGIDAGDGIVIESEDSRLALSALQILRDATERRQRGSVARSAFELRYAPEPATAPLIDLYRRMADS